MTVVFSDLTGWWPPDGRSACSAASASTSPDFLGAVQASRVEAGAGRGPPGGRRRPVDPELPLALTEALAATFDPGYH